MSTDRRNELAPSILSADFGVLKEQLLQTREGGIKLDNVHVVLEAGADLIVAGSAVYGNDILAQTKAFMERLNA